MYYKIIRIIYIFLFVKVRFNFLQKIIITYFDFDYKKFVHVLNCTFSLSWRCNINRLIIPSVLTSGQGYAFVA